MATPHSILGVDGVMQDKVEHISSGLFRTQKWTTQRTRGNRRLAVVIRFDDQCGNRHMDFSMTATVYENGRDVAGGCMHEEIAKWFPELAPLIKYHLMSTDEPMHYVANTIYHAKQHGATHAWVYYKGATASDPLGIGDDGVKERLLGYEKAEVAKRAEGSPGYRVQWDEKTTKTRNLEHARSSAVWPEATDEELCADEATLAAVLNARLPALLAAFRHDMVDVCGFEWRDGVRK